MTVPTCSRNVNLVLRLTDAIAHRASAAYERAFFIRRPSRIPIFESILPIFLIVLLGVVLRRTPFIDQSVWPGLETLGYYLFFPFLLFLTLAKADYSGIELGPSRLFPCLRLRS